MQKLLALFVIANIFLCFKLQAATAADPAENKKEPGRELLGEVSLTSPVQSKNWRFAGGLSAVWSMREDYGARSFKRFEPEVVGFYYSQLPSPKLWLRHAARLGYSADQPQMPQAVRIEETDYKIAVDEAILFSGVVTPSFAFGAGYIWRQIAAKRENPVTAVDGRLNQKLGFMWYYLQAGLGIPALDGEYLLEPMVRWQHLQADRRTTLSFGFELTRAI
jgi:hypothetical protein